MIFSPFVFPPPAPPPAPDTPTGLRLVVVFRPDPASPRDTANAISPLPPASPATTVAEDEFLFTRPCLPSGDLDLNPAAPDPTPEDAREAAATVAVAAAVATAAPAAVEAEAS